MLTFVYELSMNMVWLAAAIILLIVEGLAPGLVSIWFALGALAGCSLCGLRWSLS